MALHGYDPVTYFEHDKPQPGREAFAQHHEMYLPQFGGYCAPYSLAVQAASLFRRNV